PHSFAGGGPNRPPRGTDRERDVLLLRPAAQPARSIRVRRRTARVNSTDTISPSRAIAALKQLRLLSSRYDWCLTIVSRIFSGGMRMSTDLVAYGVYPDRASFEAGLEALRAAGFRNSDVSAILPERDRTTKDLAHEINTKAPEG